MTAKKSVKVALEVKFPFGVAVANFKSVGEEEVVSLAGDKILREWEKQIRTANTNIDRAVIKFNDGEIERDQELTEKKASYFDSFLDVDSSLVKTVEQRNAFVSRYESNVSAKLNALEDYEAKLEASIKAFNKYIDEQNEIIARYESFIVDRQAAIVARTKK